VSGRDAYWTEKYGAEEEKAPEKELVHVADGPTHSGHGNPNGQGNPHSGEDKIHMPSPSYWPIVMAMGMGVAAGGLIYIHDNFFLSRILLAGGMATTMLSIYAWALEPASADEEH
jgi:hypothetical protein